VKIGDLVKMSVWEDVGIVIEIDDHMALVYWINDKFLENWNWISTLEIINEKR
tara:strand:+ start:27426 stop:27584 length:159 start_codon:yes stop_codon:yes gene_type:complete